VSVTKILQIIASVLRVIGEISRHPVLAEFGSLEKYATIVSGLTETASKLIARGEEGIEQLREFKNHVAELRNRLDAGTLPPDELLSEVSKLRARSDAAHEGLQALKPRPDTEPAPQPTGESPQPTGESPLPAGGPALPPDTSVVTPGGTVLKS
jgi:hypothetical protein